MFHQVVERVLEFRKDQQPLIGPVEESLILHDPAEMGQLRLTAGALHRLRLRGELAQLGYLFPYLRLITGQRDRLQDPLHALPLCANSSTSS